MKQIINLLFLLIIPTFLKAQLPSEAPRTKAQLDALKFSASSGDVHKQYVLACCYLNGIDGLMSPKLKNGQKLLKQAADAGDADACKLMYKIDPIKNLRYKELAVDKYKSIQTGEAYYNIADLYSDDRNVCLRWLKTAMDYGNEKASKDMDRFYRQENAGEHTSFEQWCDNIEPFAVTKKAIAQPVIIAEQETVDTDIPQANKKNKDLFVVIIGNEQYDEVDDVEFAENDATVFERYCRLTLGAQPNNIRSYHNLTYARIGSAIRDMKDKVDVNKGQLDVIFFYAGHGIPSEDGKRTFLLPVDADGKDLSACYPLEKLYDELGNLGARSVVAFIDACFSGSNRNDVALAHNRAPHMRYKTAVPQRKTVVFSAASSGETAWQYKEKQHGLFTYYLLKKLQETKGDCTLGELASYIESNVGNTSLDVNHKRQTPTVSPSMDIESTWKTFKLK